ncbi:hypothetical protein Tcan_08613 [Toxocara canis]|uniref:Uncharacterized protein n=1 Tax=Toxocara canis TaxID=6265 RepID=A0A0B2VJK7_TOXCA|nr:hypothetical protein Tcan_08613 [Toxocara canis]
MYEVEEDLIPCEQLSRDEELVESTASSPPVKEYEYRYEKEEISPSREQKEPFVEEAPVSVTAPDAEKLAEETGEAQFDERRGDERKEERATELEEAEIERVIEHKVHYESKEDGLPIEEEEGSVAMFSKRREDRRDTDVVMEELMGDKEFREGVPIAEQGKGYEYGAGIIEQLAPSTEETSSFSTEEESERIPEEKRNVTRPEEGRVDYECRHEITKEYLPVNERETIAVPAEQRMDMDEVEHITPNEHFIRDEEFEQHRRSSTDKGRDVASPHAVLASQEIRGRGIDEEALSNVHKVGIHHIESPSETVAAESESTRPSAGQSESERSSGRDDILKIASGDMHLCDATTDKIVEDFSEQIVNDVLEAVGRSVTEGCKSSLRRSISSDNQSAFFDEDVGPLPKSSSQGIEREHEVDYESDLKEKLDALANESKSIQLEEFHIADAVRHDFIEEESDEETINELEINEEVAEMVDDVLKNVTEALSHSDSTYKTATSRDGYETCVTSQEDTFETAPGWQSQESEYTTATSGGESCLSEASEERRGSATPIAMLSPVQSDRHFTAAQDHEQELSAIRNFSVYFDSKRTTPEVPEIELPLVEDDEELDEERLATSASGVLLLPEADPGRPVSPTPPRIIEEEDQGIFIVTSADSSVQQVQAAPISSKALKVESIRTSGRFDEESMRGSTVSITETCTTEDVKPHITEAQHPLGSELFRPSGETIHEKAMDVEQEYARQYSDISSESRAETVVDKTAVKNETTSSSDVSSGSAANVRSDSSDSLDKISLRSGSSGKRYSTSRRSSNGSRKSSHEEPQTFVERLTPELKMTWCEADQRTGGDQSPKQETPLSSPEEEFRGYSPEEPIRPSEVELETVEEEPEDADSLNGQSVSSNGQTTDSAILGKYKHVSSDNVSETSLQEFERIERDVLNKGESSLSGSELELYAATKLKTSADGSTSSLAEFERLEQEVGEGSPQEEVMMLSDIREESEVEDMSVRDDDEEEPDSISDIKSVPVGEEIQAPTPIASPTDSIEKDFEHVIPELLQTSTDSLEPEVFLITDRKDEKEGFEEYEIIDKTDESLRDSLENIPHDRDSLLEGASSQEMASQDTRAMLSGDTVGTYQEYQEDERDSLAGDMDTMLGDYPTTLTTFETTQVNEDGSVETISRRVLTRVKDPVISHVQFTGTESEQRLRELAREEEYETVDSEGNVTRTILHRRRPSPSKGRIGRERL